MPDTTFNDVLEYFEPIAKSIEGITYAPKEGYDIVHPKHGKIFEVTVSHSVWDEYFEIDHKPFMASHYHDGDDAEQTSKVHRTDFNQVVVFKNDMRVL